MIVEKTRIQDCLLLKPNVIKDLRGEFMESYNHEKFVQATGLEVNFVQDNLSTSSKNVVRGLHAQTGDMAQAKLVMALRGEVLDVVVDMRPDSPSYKKHITVKLDEENRHQLFVPRGCYHGFSVLSEEVLFYYKCDNYYSKVHESGIKYDDPVLNIDWQVKAEDMLISDKDQILPFMNDLTV
ncbi:MAG: dTDP-4-dehydrorhamnose 3,5-epimerase [Nonlabens sp.]